MAIPLLGKIVISAVTLAVIAGMTVTIILIVNDSSEQYETPTEMTTPVPEDDGSVVYQVGVGIADMTGPCVEINFMGYADVGQSGEGLHLRQFARSFIFVRDQTRVVLVSAEVQAVGIAVRRQVVNNLQRRYGDMYTLRNVIVAGTHTHSAPGGHLVDFLLDISILGFSRETFNAYVDGITRSIIRAHESVVPARLYSGQTRVYGAHMNRSPYSYRYNPAEERVRYDGDTDDILTQIRIVKEDGTLHGVMNWFSVHTTSMNMTNKLISSDNLGYAALRMEQELNPGSLAGKPTIVTAFFTSSLGDVSPNTQGARCQFSGVECDNQFLLCAAGELCFASGPGDDMFESTKIIGTTVYQGAMEVLNSPAEELRGQLAVVHQFVEMPDEVAAKYDPITDTFNVNEPVRGCVPAMGYSFASGTIDGANTLNITQGTIQGNPLLDLISGVVAEATPEDVECHAPKPILLATGRANFPLPWHPRIVSVSLIWLGDLAIVGIPGEPTTMAGRRLKRVVGSVMESRGFEPRVVVAGLTNEYIHYVSTFEEYQVQRYEAASTIFGPNTLDILLNKFNEFTSVAIEGADVPSGPEPGNFMNRTLSIIPPVLFDMSQLGREFGEVMRAPPATVERGGFVSASFMAGNPRNDLRHESSHATVERLVDGEWIVVANDADWNTKFRWERIFTLVGTSRATFEWTVPEDEPLGPHRLVYYGAARNILGSITQFRGETDSFEVTDKINYIS